MFRIIIITSQYRRSEPSLSLLSLTFRFASPILVFRAIITSSFGVQSHRHHYPDWCSESYFQFWRSEPSLSHSQYRHSKSSSSLLSLTFRFASPISAFRAIFRFVRHSEPCFASFDVQSHIPDFSVQSHHHIFVRRSESSLSLLSIGVQSHHHHFLV